MHDTSRVRSVLILVIPHLRPKADEPHSGLLHKHEADELRLLLLECEHRWCAREQLVHDSRMNVNTHFDHCVPLRESSPMNVLRVSNFIGPFFSSRVVLCQCQVIVLSATIGKACIVFEIQVDIFIFSLVSLEASWTFHKQKRQMNSDNTTYMWNTKSILLALPCLLHSPRGCCSNKVAVTVTPTLHQLRSSGCTRSEILRTFNTRPRPFV